MHLPNAIRKTITSFWPYVVILLITAVLLATNYAPGTWLTGWDNLHPEFNCSVNIVDRSLFSVWQEYQGLGVRAGNAHAADLIHQVGVCLAGTVLPTPFLRYLYHFLALSVGTIGAYICIRRLFLKKHDGTRIAAFCGAVYYMLNLGTMQYFSVPYEAFSHFFAAFPWLLLTVVSYLELPTKKRLIAMTLVTFLATPMFYIPTICIVYLGVIGVLSVLHLMRKKSFRPLLVTYLVFLCLNAFWLFPFVGFVRNGTAFVAETKINRIFTEEAFLRSQQFGALPDVMTLKGFLFNTTDLDVASGTHDFVMQPWIRYLKQPVPFAVSLSFFVLVVIGSVIMWTKKYPGRWLYTILLGVGIFAFVNDNPPTGWLFHTFQDVLPFFRQIFRFPFTKFLPIIALMYGTGISVAITTLTRNKAYRSITLCIFLVSISVAFFPSFQGNFLYRRMRVAIPQEYFELFDYFQTKNPHGKIALLPQPTFWGWTTYDWGYRGSGFPWYGIRQPVLDRNFDVWNTQNEMYYEALTRALYASDRPSDLEQVLKTYGIASVWLDERVILPGNPEALYIEEIKARLAQIPSVHLAKTINKQSVYTVDTESNEGILLQPVSGTQYPFLKPNSYTITETPEDIVLSGTVPSGILTIPPLVDDVTGVPAGITQEKQGLRITPIIPKLSFEEMPLDEATKDASIFLPVALNSNVIATINDTVFTTGDTDTIAAIRASNILSLYTPKQDSINIAPQLFQRPIHSCMTTQPTTAGTFGKTEIRGNNALIGRASTPCIYEKLSTLAPALPKNAEIVQIRLTYKSATKIPRICLSKEGQTACIFSAQDAPDTITPDNWASKTYTIPLTAALDDLWIKTEFDADGAQEEQIIFSDIGITTYQTPFRKISFTMQETKPRTYQLPAQGTVTVRIPKKYQSIPLSMNTSGNAKSCYQLGTGTYNKTLEQDQINGLVSRYEAKRNASVCDWIQIPTTASLSDGFILSTLTKNREGRPIKTCLKLRPPGICLYEEILPVTKADAWTTVHALLQPLHKANPLWFYELDNYAVGKEVRINEIASIRLTPIPYRWLSSVSVKPDTDTGQPVTTDGVAVSTVVSHPNPSYYVVALNQKEVTKNETLILSQTFDTGWHAYTKKSGSVPHWLFEAVPFLFGTELPQHVLVNNWENGWTIPTATEGQVVIIFFLPQLLEYIGFLLLPVPFFFIIKTKLL